MEKNIPEIDLPNVYEYLLTEARSHDSYMEMAVRMARFSPIYPDDPRWQTMVLNHDDKVSGFLDEDLKLIGIVFDEKCIGYCGYRFIKEPMIIIQGKDVILPYELYMIIDEDLEISSDMVYSAQLYIATYEKLKEVITETC
jgi:hypothetical protein